MERENRVQQQQTAETESTGLESAGTTLSAPAFQLSADGGDAPPIQRQEAPEGGDTTTASPTVEATNEGQQSTTATPPQPVNVNITQSVGVGGANLPADVRQVQERLQQLGYLSATDFQAEQADPAGTTAIAENAMTQTIIAITRYLTAAMGQPGRLIQPNQASSSFMNQQPAQALGSLALSDRVGEGSANNAADVILVQQRLIALGKLDAATLGGELVAAGTTGTIADASLAQTIAAIREFNASVVGISLHYIRPASRELEMLNNPPRFTAASVSITNTVGTGMQNNPADITALQARLLALGYLSATDQTAEAPAAGATERVADANLARTIAALSQFQQAMNIGQTGTLSPMDQTHRQLINPALPEQGNLNITGSVGRGGANNAADVRAVQDRLQTVGILTTANYLAEKVDAAAGTAIGMDTVPHTRDAIDLFCRTVAGGTDGRIDAGGRAMRLLNDPTYLSGTNFNTETNNGEAGFDFQSNDAEVNRVIGAIEAIEAGNHTGEIGAVLTNGAGTAASFGKGQVIGSTALGVLSNNQGMRDHYGLTQAMLTDMTQRSNNTETHYNDIYALVPNATMTQAALSTAIDNYTSTHGERFVRETGLGYEDIARMFHTANMRRRITAAPIGRSDNGVAIEGQLNGAVQTLMGNAAFSTSTTFLGVNSNSVKTYLRRLATMGENKAAFRTKAIFNHPEGQRVRNAMTDNNGTAIGRTFVESTHQAANRAVPADAATRMEFVGAITAIMHNSGGTAANWARRRGEVYGNAYVGRFLPQYRRR